MVWWLRIGRYLVGSFFDECLEFHLFVSCPVLG
jgi:hypothetical protein